MSPIKQVKKLSRKYQSFSVSFFKKPASFQICLVWITCNERHVKKTWIFSPSVTMTIVNIEKKTKNMAQSKRLELQTPGRPQNS